MYYYIIYETINNKEIERDTNIYYINYKAENLILKNKLISIGRT